MAEHTVASLIKKIARAEIKLEEAKVNHKDNCVTECDMESIAPCNCGASEYNAAISAALRELEL